jgi:peptidoglycan hydrolase-like protein with peptidoglycan-binding domain
VFARSDLPRADNVNFRVSVGTVVPARVRVVTVPQEIVEIRPQFRNHLFFVVRDEIVILDNRRRIVEVIPVQAAGGGGRAVRGSSAEFVDLSTEEIREVQQVLIQRGFSVEVDGRLGPRTQQALIQFQRREGLQATGRIDSRTIASLGVSVKSNQGSGGQQPSTTGQGGASQGGADQPSSNQGASEPQRGQQGQQGQQQPGSSSSPQNRSDAPASGQGSGTTGQGQSSGQDSGADQPANQGAGSSGQGGTSNPAEKQAPPSGGGTGGGSTPRGQSK